MSARVVDGVVQLGAQLDGPREAQCLLRESHAVHTWYYTSEGGGHMLDPEVAVDELAEEAAGKVTRHSPQRWECPGLSCKEAIAVNMAPLQAEITRLHGSIGTLGSEVHSYQQAKAAAVAYARGREAYHFAKQDTVPLNEWREMLAVLGEEC